MRKLILFVFFALMVTRMLNAQPANKSDKNSVDSIAKIKAKSYRDSLENDFVSKAEYPLIKTSKFSGVIPVNNVDEKPDPNQQYKLVMEVTTGMRDSASAKEINEAIAEVGRIMNIHIASGIPKKNLNVVVVAHGPVLKAFYNDGVYREKYKTTNPNIAVFNELLASGVKFIACGQAMYFFDVKKEEMMPWMKVAVSAQSTLTNYQLKGYLLKKIETDK